MHPRRNGLSQHSPLRPLSVLIFHLLLTHSCRGQSKLMGPPKPVVATVGDDIILPCHLEPAVDVAATILEWTRSDLNSIFAFVWRAGQDLVHMKHPSYKGRTSLFTDELKRGNISLKLSDVRPSDAGRYRCFILKLNKDSFVELVVGAVSSPVISLAGIDKASSGVVLDCESKGWYPEPEVLWLDGEGNLLSAGPTETVRGPDDLYTVSSRVTVEKRHSNSFTCRVQQNNINQTRETHIQVPDDFFKVQSSSSSTITGLAVSLAVCIMVILLLVFFVWKQRNNNNTNTKGSPADVTDTGGRQNPSEDQSATKEEMKALKEKGEKKGKHWQPVSGQKFQEEQQRREEAENKVKNLEQKLQDEQTRREEAEREVQMKEQELQKRTAELQEEKKSRIGFEEKVKTLEQELQNKNTQLKGNQAENIRQLLQEKKEKDKAQREVETLKNQLETQKQELQDEKRKNTGLETEVKTLKQDIKTKDSQLETSQRKEADTRHQLSTKLSTKTTEWMDLKRELEEQLQDEKKKTSEFERKLKALEEELLKKNTQLEQQLQDEKGSWMEFGEKVKTLKQSLQNRNTQLQDEQTRRGEAEREVQMMEQELWNQLVKLEEQLHYEDSRERFEEIVKTLKQSLLNKNTQLQDEQTRRGEAEREGQRKQQELWNQIVELERKQAETIKQLQWRVDKAQREVQTLKNQLEPHKQEVSVQYSGSGHGSVSSTGHPRSTGSLHTAYYHRR